jgi:hypothetical protein
MRVTAWTMIGCCLATCASCIGFHGPEDLRRDLVQATGVEVERESAVSVGRMGVLLVRWFTPEDEIPLRGVRRVQVGVYEVADRGARGYGNGTVDRLELPGWEPVVRVQEDDEDVFVLIRQKEGSIRGMLVVIMEQDEWVLVRVKGKLQHVVEEAMRMAFDEAEHPELYEPAAAEYRAASAEAS